MQQSQIYNHLYIIFKIWKKEQLILPYLETMCVYMYCKYLYNIFIYNLCVDQFKFLLLQFIFPPPEGINILFMEITLLSPICLPSSSRYI